MDVANTAQRKMVSRMDLPSKMRYPELTRIDGCDTPLEEIRGTRTIVPACLGGTSLLGCVGASECSDIVWSSKGNEGIRESLSKLHGVQVSEPVHFRELEIQ